MKVILQAFEPIPQPFVAATDVAEARPVTRMVRKPRVRLNPVFAETRLFHAL